MKQFLILLCIFAATTRALEFKRGLRAKFGRGDGAGTTYYYPVPQDVATAKTQSWVKKTRPSGALPSLTDMYCESQMGVCGLYDDNGFIAGMMTAVQKDKLTGGAFDAKIQGFTEWVVDGITYYTMAQFFVDDAYLKQAKATRAANRDTTKVLQLDHIYLTSFHGNLVKIPVAESALDPIWAKQGCVSGMGTHYYYNLTNQVCTSDTISPWSVLYTDGKLVCSLWFDVGSYPDTLATTIERPNAQIGKLSFPDAPDCFLEVGLPGLTLHTYFVDNPAEITCA